MKTVPELREITTVMGVDSDQPPQKPIQKNDVKRWMQSSDIETLGAVYELVMNRRYSSLIEPPLEFTDYHDFVKHYYERCFIENPDGDWSDSRYSVGWSLCNWFKGLWDDPDIQRAILADLKSWMAALYTNGNDELKNCLVTATFEHLFNRKDIAKYFSDWKKDDRLKIAYAEAMEWQVKPNRRGDP
jgi:hypothetical protein